MSNGLQGRNVAVFGVANKRSIAWAIAQQMQAAGAQLAITYQNERLKQEADDLIAALPNAQAFQCDVSRDEEIDATVRATQAALWQARCPGAQRRLCSRRSLKDDFVAHQPRSVSHRARHQCLLAGRAIARRAPLMTDGGSILTLTYYGAEKVVPRYNVMGVAKAALEACVRYLAYDLGKQKIRVNAISAGPIKTLAARGIGALGEMLKGQAERSPLQRNIDVNEVATTAVFLAGDGATGITGETIYVDCGYNIMGF